MGLEDIPSFFFKTTESDQNGRMTEFRYLVVIGISCTMCMYDAVMRLSSDAFSDRGVTSSK